MEFAAEGRESSGVRMNTGEEMVMEMPDGEIEFHCRGEWSSGC